MNAGLPCVCFCRDWESCLHLAHAGRCVGSALTSQQQALPLSVTFTPKALWFRKRWWLARVSSEVAPSTTNTYSVQWPSLLLLHLLERVHNLHSLLRSFAAESHSLQAYRKPKAASRRLEPQSAVAEPASRCPALTLPLFASF